MSQVATAPVAGQKQLNVDALRKLLDSNSLDADAANLLRSAIALQSAEPARFAIIAPSKQLSSKGKVNRYAAKFEISASLTNQTGFPKLWGVSPDAVRAILASPEAAAAALVEIDSKYPGGYWPEGTEPADPTK